MFLHDPKERERSHSGWQVLTGSHAPPRSSSAWPPLHAGATHACAKKWKKKCLRQSRRQKSDRASSCQVKAEALFVVCWGAILTNVLSHGGTDTAISSRCTCVASIFDLK